MKNYDFQEKHFQISDPIESYFECISTCDLNDGNYEYFLEKNQRHKKIWLLLIKFTFG